MVDQLTIVQLSTNFPFHILPSIIFRSFILSLIFHFPKIDFLQLNSFPFIPLDLIAILKASPSNMSFVLFEMIEKFENQLISFFMSYRYYLYTRYLTDIHESLFIQSASTY
jgi:hypothetical protein